MSVNVPPNPNVSTFNNDYWIHMDTALTTADADLRYLRWNVAQGDETLQGISVNGNANFYSQTNFNDVATGSLTSLAVQPLANDSTTKIPTTAWVQSAITGAPSSILATNNTFTGTNAFNNIAPITSTATQPASNDSSTKIPTTAWVQTAVSGGSILATNNIFTGTNTFNNDLVVKDQLTINDTTLVSNTQFKQQPNSFTIELTGTNPTYDMGVNGALIQTYNTFNNIMAFPTPTTFINVAPPTSTATQPASNDSSTKIPTTAWVQTAVSGSSILATNNTFTGTNAFNNIAPITSTATQPASNDSSTKIPTTAWVQSAITAIPSLANLTPNSVTITRTNVASSSTAGITNNYNNGGYIDQGITSANNVAYNANFTPNIPLKIIFANNSGNPSFSPYSAGAVIVNINCFFSNASKTSYGQTECKLTLFGNLLSDDFGTGYGDTTYNLNNQINGNGAFNYSSPTYAPTGRQYWTYDQVFSGALSATPAYLQGINNLDGTYTIFVYFQAEQVMTWSYNATIINAAGLITAGGKGVYLG